MAKKAGTISAVMRLKYNRIRCGRYNVKKSKANFVFLSNP